jgi:hypothetical protein
LITYIYINTYFPQNFLKIFFWFFGKKYYKCFLGYTLSQRDYPPFLTPIYPLGEGGYGAGGVYRGIWGVIGGGDIRFGHMVPPVVRDCIWGLCKNNDIYN